MTIDDMIVHERTLLGALDSFQGALVRTRPQVASEYGIILDDFAARWLDSGYPNSITSISQYWIRAYLASSEQRATAEAALHSFFSWVVAQDLVEQHPMEAVFLS